MAWSFPIGHLFGSELRVHSTFFLLLAWIGVAAYIDGGAAAAALSLLYVLVLFACVVAHEFGHALTARRFGIRTPDVTLLPIGGLARMERMPEKPGQEMLVAIAGPLVNVAIFLVLLIVLGPARIFSASLDTISLAQLPAQIALVNLLLAAFNLLPAFPMDGGRVLRAALTALTDRESATRNAAIVGRVLAIGMGLVGLAINDPVLLLIAVFVFISAGAEGSQEAMQTLARTRLARDAMITEYESLGPDDSLDAAATTLIRTAQHEFPVVDPANGAPLGLLTRTALYKALEASPRPQRVAEVMLRDIPAVRLADRLETALAGLQGNTPAVFVSDRSGALVGFITRENLGELMVVSAARRG